MKKSKTRKASPSGKMSLSGHLKELRNRIIAVLLVLLVGFCICLYFSPRLMTLMTDMGKEYDYVFVYIAPAETLLVEFSIALIGGLVIAFPVLAYNIFAFCSPGLKRKERTFVRASLLGGTVFFVLGVLFAYYISLPFMLRFLIQLTGSVDVSASISIQQYISFLLTVFLIFGIVFEMPVITVLLTTLGILKAEWLAKARKIAIVLIFLLAAFITPPDVVSQFMVAGPMVLLYELSILLCRLFARRKNTSDEDEDDEDEDEDEDDEDD